jgi:hypothetical protein
MSLVIALSASRKAAVGADKRAISFFGSCQELEEELYSGRILNDQQLEAKAKEHNSIIYVSDGREKVWRRGDILVGEVTEISTRVSRRRRIYVSPGVSLQVDITSNGITSSSTTNGSVANGSIADGSVEEENAAEGVTGGFAKIRAWGGIGCVIFGNRFTQRLAADEIALAGGRVDEALIDKILYKAGERTASVSREHTVLSSDVRQSDARAAILRVFEEDCKESGWRICDPQ